MVAPSPSNPVAVPLRDAVDRALQLAESHKLKAKKTQVERLLRDKVPKPDGRGFKLTQVASWSVEHAPGKWRTWIIDMGQLDDELLLMLKENPPKRHSVPSKINPSEVAQAAKKET